MDKMINRLSRSLSVDNYNTIDVARWLEIFMGKSLDISETDGDLVAFIYDDLICALRVDEDGMVEEFIDLDEDDIEAINFDPANSGPTPEIYDDFEQYREAIRTEYTQEDKIYSAEILKPFTNS